MAQHPHVLHLLSIFPTLDVTSVIVSTKKLLYKDAFYNKDLPFFKIRFKSLSTFFAVKYILRRA
jgi:hypothetical protein